MSGKLWPVYKNYWWFNCYDSFHAYAAGSYAAMMMYGLSAINPCELILWHEIITAIAALARVRYTRAYHISPVQ